MAMKYARHRYAIAQYAATTTGFTGTCSATRPGV
jgi:hypothetical protein